MSREMTGSWSREQIASGLRLAGSGVPVAEVIRMMGVSPEVFSTWNAEYAELFDKLIIRLPEQTQLNNATKATGFRRIAYLSGCVGGEEVESELHACKLPYSVIENPAAVAGKMLRSGSVLGNFQKPLSWNCSPSAARPLLEGSSAKAVPAASSGLADSSWERLSEKQERETDGFQMGQAPVSFLVLVSTQIVNPNRNSLQHGASGGETALSGVLSGKIDELRWRTELADGGQIDVPIVQDVGLKFNLDGILDAPIDAIRAFYTSPVDALLLGNFLIKKSDSPSRKT